MSFPEQIVRKRQQLKETQGEFGKRFGVTAMAISYFERGLREAPYKVLYFCIADPDTKDDPLSLESRISFLEAEVDTIRGHLNI